MENAAHGQPVRRHSAPVHIALHLPTAVKHLAERQDAVVSRDDLLHAGVDAAVLRDEILSGRWQRAGPRAVVLHNGPLTTQQELWVALVTTCATAVLAGPTAAQASGLRGFATEEIHVCVAKGAHVRHMPGVRVHVLRRLREEDVDALTSPPRTRTPVSVIDTALWRTHARGATAVVAAAVQQGLASPGQLREVMHRVRRHPHRRPILLALADVEMGAQALSEIDFARLCRSAGLPEPSRQRVRMDPTGKRRYLDVEWDKFGLVVEVDGAHHMKLEVWSEDLTRQNEEVIDGRRVLRFSSITVRTEEPRVVSQLRRALR